MITAESLFKSYPNLSSFKTSYRGDDGWLYVDINEKRFCASSVLMGTRDHFCSDPKHFVIASFLKIKIKDLYDLCQGIFNHPHSDLVFLRPLNEKTKNV